MYWTETAEIAELYCLIVLDVRVYMDLTDYNKVAVRGVFQFGKSKGWSLPSLYLFIYLFIYCFSHFLEVVHPPWFMVSLHFQKQQLLSNLFHIWLLLHWLFCLPLPLKNPCDHIVPTQIIQNSLHILMSDEQFNSICNLIFLLHVAYQSDSQDELWTSLWGH